MSSITLNEAQIKTMLDTLDDLRQHEGLSARQIALRGDLMRALGQTPAIRGTLSTGRLVELPVRIGGAL